MKYCTHTEVSFQKGSHTVGTIIMFTLVFYKKGFISPSFVGVVPATTMLDSSGVKKVQSSSILLKVLLYNHDLGSLEMLIKNIKFIVV